MKTKIVTLLLGLIASQLLFADPEATLSTEEAPPEPPHYTPSESGEGVLSLPLTIDMVSVGTAASFFNISTSCITANQYCAFLNAVAATGDPHHLYAEVMEAPIIALVDSTGNPIKDPKGLESLLVPKVPYIHRSLSADKKSYTYTVVDCTTKTKIADNTYVTFGQLAMNNVSLFDAARFCNWLHHGQPVGPEGNDTTETGAYLINEAYNPMTKKNQIVFQTITFQPGGKWCLPTQDAWIAFVQAFGPYYLSCLEWEWTMSPYEITARPPFGHNHYGGYWQMSPYPPGSRNRFAPENRLKDTGFRIIQLAQ